MRWFAWAFILWQVFWLNIFIPGHTRGAYGVVPDGKARAAATPSAQATPKPEEHSCCAVSPTPETGGKTDGTPTEDQKRRCIVCFIAKDYALPTVYVFDVPLTGSVVERANYVAAQVQVLAFGFPFYPAGPPVA